MWFIKKIFLLLFSVIAFSQTELKFNLATAPLLIPNIGIEVKLSDKLGCLLDTSASFYNDIEGSPFHMTQIFNEFRYYPNKNQKRNFLLELMLDMECIISDYLMDSYFLEVNLKKRSYQYGRNAYYGITIGKKFH